MTNACTLVLPKPLFFEYKYDPLVKLRNTPPPSVPTKTVLGLEGFNTMVDTLSSVMARPEFITVQLEALLVLLKIPDPEAVPAYIVLALWGLMAKART